MNDNVQKTKNYIEGHYSLIKRVQSVAVALGLPYDHLRKEFARHIGKSMQAYLEEVRINAALLKLRDRKKLYEVAREVGYAHETTLIKHFKKIAGMTPHEYYKLFEDDEEESEP